ncbi:hypothetical protein Tco_0633181 [Tanacetum coccineum]
MNFVLMMNCKAKKIIKFKLGGRSHNLTLLEFAHRLGLYLADELDEDGFNVYFEGGFHSDEHFNSQEYWLSISREENIGLSRSHTSTIRSPILRVIHKMITYGLCQRMTGSGCGGGVVMMRLVVAAGVMARGRGGVASAVVMVLAEWRLLGGRWRHGCGDVGVMMLMILVDRWWG